MQLAQMVVRQIRLIQTLPVIHVTIVQQLTQHLHHQVVPIPLQKVVVRVNVRMLVLKVVLRMVPNIIKVVGHQNVPAHKHAVVEHVKHSPVLHLQAIT